MNQQEQVRFDMLRNGPCVTVAYLQDYYEIRYPLRDDLHVEFTAWGNTLKRRQLCGDQRISRYELETFIQQQGVIPNKWMAARLGMKLNSFEQLMERIQLLNMRRTRYQVFEELVAETFSEDIVTLLPGMRFRVFSDQNNFCERLHAELEKSLKLKVEPLFCATSVQFQDYPQQYARHFDCITTQPVSGKHQMWLNFRKPLSLSPDRCSKLFYAENRELMQEYRAGIQEPDLEEYEDYLAGLAHA